MTFKLDKAVKKAYLCNTIHGVEDNIKLRIMNSENDTLYAGKELEGRTAKKMEDKGVGGKVALGTVAGALGGAGGSYAIGNYINKEGLVSEEDETSTRQNEGIEKEENAQQEVMLETDTTTEENKISASEVTGVAEVKPIEAVEESDFFDEHKVKIDDIEVKTDSDGKIMHLATGEMNGHRAIFVEDGSGQVKGVVVDENDNRVFDENEYYDLSDRDVSLQDLADHKQDDVEVKVIAVNNDVNIEGRTVDVAAIEINDEPVVLVDVTQNGEVDIAMADVNHNGQIEQSEVRDVAEAHMPMPSANDVYGQDMTMTSQFPDVLPDYSDDSDITLYNI